ncbi:MAG: hypothetical protein HKN25_11150 [Pyrinomonadaceae bacterium]|nr:hypothetical protein [Pyrinomonadaceae bacterium]
MKYLAKILVLAFILALGVILASGWIASFGDAGKAFLFPSAPVEVDENTPTKNSETAIAALKQNCGTCHRSTLSTAKPKALAIFDLDKRPWHESVTDKHLKGISGRIKTKSGLSDLERTATLEFISCVRSLKADKPQAAC